MRIADRCRPIVEPNIKNAVLVFPDTLTEIGERAFMVSSRYNSKKLWHPVFSEIYFSNSVRIGVCAFYGQSGLEKLHFGEFEDIDKEAFRGCDGLEKVSFKKCWLSRGSFMHCKKLSEVSWKAAVSTGGEVFYGTPFEEKQKLLIIGDTLQKCRTDEKIFTVPEGVKTIGENAFENNKAIERVILPPSVKIIKRRAFVGCENLWDIDLRYVQMICSDAFENCRSLDSRAKFGVDTTFQGYPFTRTALEKESVTKDGIVINGVLFSIRPDFSGSLWQISDNVRREHLKTPVQKRKKVV